MTKKFSRLSEAILEMAGDQYRIGLMDKTEYEKITTASHGQTDQGQGDPKDEREGQPEPGRLRPFSQSERGLYLAVGAGNQAAERTGAGALECDQAQGV